MEVQPQNVLELVLVAIEGLDSRLKSHLHVVICNLNIEKVCGDLTVFIGIVSFIYCVFLFILSGSNLPFVSIRP